MNIKITDIAKEEMNKIKKASGKEYLRLDAGARTCCDIIFTLRAGDYSEEDKIYEIEGFKILIEEDLDGIYENFSIDYTNEGFTRGFNIAVFKFVK